MSKAKENDGARLVLLRALCQNGEISVEEAAEIIRPYLHYDHEAMEKQKARRAAQSIIRSRKDASGTRTCFAVNHDGNMVYVDTDQCQNVEIMKELEEQLYKRAKGAEKSYRKVEFSLGVLQGSIELDELTEKLREPHPTFLYK